MDKSGLSSYLTDFNDPDYKIHTSVALKIGDRVHLWDGEGCEATAQISRIHPLNTGDFIYHTSLEPNTLGCAEQ